MKKIFIILVILALLLVGSFIILKNNQKEEITNIEQENTSSIKEIIEDTTPYLLDEQCEIIEEDTKKGMTIKDSYGNEWVWIVVPKTQVFKTAKNETDYNAIKNDIKEYVKDYQLENYEDINIQEDVLKSIYTYGGFWISRYEAGTDKRRNQDVQTMEEPYSQANKYVYNYVTFEQANELATNISGSKYKSSLLYGFQWDLVCKFIEQNGYTLNNEKISEDMINSNSSSWGNYYSSSFTINRGKYSLNYGIDYTDVNNEEIKKTYKTYLLTTGSSEQNKACNIYDFAGNVSEWTLESVVNDDIWKVIRDGSFYFNYGGNDPVNGRYNLKENSRDTSYGFRISIIK